MCSHRCTDLYENFVGGQELSYEAKFQTEPSAQAPPPWIGLKIPLISGNADSSLTHEFVDLKLLDIF